MTERAYSFLEIKSVVDDGEHRIIEGIATTPEPDHIGDVMDPMGAKFTLPLPFCIGHPSTGGKPIGDVTKAMPSKDGIHIRAEIRKSSGLEYVEEAWKQIKAKLVRGLSIGFVPIGRPERSASGGSHYKAWHWAELSAVVVPMNTRATIQVIKSLSHDPRPAVSGNGVVRLSPSGLGQQQNGQKDHSMNYQENIDAFKRKRDGLALDLKTQTDAIVNKGETADADQQEKVDGLVAEISTIDKHLTMLTNVDAISKGFVISAPPSASGDVRPNVSSRPYMTVSQTKQEPGIGLARVVKCLGKARGNVMLAEQIARNTYKDDPRIEMVIKAAVAAGTTGVSAWAGFLVGDETSLVAEFLEYLRPKTIIGQFGQGNIPSLSRIPFRTPYLTQTTAGAGYWTGEGKGKGLTQFDGARATLEPLKVANIAVLTKEVLRDSSPSAEVWVRNQLVEAVRARMDIDFIDPAKAASAGISPASITNGITPITASGLTADDVRSDLKALFQNFIEANNAPTSAVFLMSSTIALALSLMTNSLGQSEFPGITMNGGTLAGIPVLTSEHVPNATAGGIIVLVNARDIFLADEGGFEVDMSEEASLQMDDTPTQSSITTIAATSVVSMFQTNSVAFRCERTMNWVRARDSGVGYIQTVNYGE